MDDAPPLDRTKKLSQNIPDMSAGIVRWWRQLKSTIGNLPTKLVSIMNFSTNIIEWQKNVFDVFFNLADLLTYMSFMPPVTRRDILAPL